MGQLGEFRSRRHSLARLAAATALLIASSPVVATEYSVNRTDDTTAATACGGSPGDCSLRGAILDANARPGPDIIDLQAGATYKLTLGPSDSGLGQIDATHGDLDVTDDLVINGNGATVDAAGLDRVFSIENGSLTPFTVTLKGLTITGGVAKGFLSSGGGINVRAATLNLVGCTITGNSTVDGVSTDNGGGIAANGVLFPSPALAYLNLTDTMVTGNTGGNGGGISCGSCSLMLDHSMVAGNTADGAVGGGGIFATGAGSSVLILNQSAVTMNASASDGGGISLFTAQLVVTNGAVSNDRANRNGGGISNSQISPGSMAVTGSALTGNVAASGGNGAGGGIFNGGGVVAMHFSRVFANTAGAGSGTGVQNSGGTADVRNDWWGCNSGPSTTPCDDVSGSNVASDPWLTLHLAAAQSTIFVGRQANLIADLTRNSAGMNTSGSGHIPDGTQADFSASLGSVSPPVDGVSGGRAGTVYTAGANQGKGVASVAMDHQAASVDLNIVVPGDLNGDGVVDAKDLALMIKFILGVSVPSSLQLAAGDVRPKPGINDQPFGDGQLRTDDLNWLFRRYLGLNMGP